MILRLIMLLFLCANTVSAMEKITIESQNSDMPRNFKELMPNDYIHCAELASKENFDEIKDFILSINKEGESVAEWICSDLKGLYFATKKGFAEHHDEYDDSVTEEKQIYNNMLRYFWHRHYVHVLDEIAFEKYDAEVQQRRFQTTSTEELSSSSLTVTNDIPSKEEHKAPKRRRCLDWILSCFRSHKKNKTS